VIEDMEERMLGITKELVHVQAPLEVYVVDLTKNHAKK
jgi:hypothetical protein